MREYPVYLQNHTLRQEFDAQRNAFVKRKTEIQAHARKKLDSM